MQETKIKMGIPLDAARVGSNIVTAFGQKSLNVS